MEIPKEYRMYCSTCEKWYDARNLGQVMWHIEEDCVTDTPVPDIEYTSVRKLGENVEWTKDGRKIDLN